MATDLKRCARLAEAIRAIDADVIALQEVESLAALTWFRDTWLKDAGYKHLASLDVGYYRGVECSVMSRIKITNAKVWLNESLDNVKRDGPGWAAVPEGAHLTFQRSPLMIDLETDGGYKFTVFSVHHKAGSEFDYHREAEALRIVDLVDGLRKDDPGRNIIVMGDFNASPFDKSYRVYLRAGMIDTMAHRLWQGDGPEVALYKTHESNRVLDYILMNSAAHRELVIGSQFVYGTPLPPASYDYRKDPFPEGYASDHYPVVVEVTPMDQR
jgi:endonuclease/exonuclease/phosphatase family metal-dependent hydrolase